MIQPNSSNGLLKLLEHKANSHSTKEDTFMTKGAILIGYGSVPTKADVEDAIKSGWIKNADTVSTTSFPAGTEPNGDLHFMTYLIMKKEKGWDDPGDLQSMKITTADKRVIYSVYPSEGIDTLKKTIPPSANQQTTSTKWWELWKKGSPSKTDQIKSLYDKGSEIVSSWGDHPSIDKLEELMAINDKIANLGDWAAHGHNAFLCAQIIYAYMDWGQRSISSLPIDTRTKLNSYVNLGLEHLNKFLDKGGDSAFDIFSPEEVTNLTGQLEKYATDIRNEFGKKQSNNVSNSPQGFLTFSSFDAAQAGEEMGEMYFQCPKCGTYERINDIGKMMLKSDPSYFTSIDCIKCKHTYNARVRIQKGRCPGFDYSEIDEAEKQKEEEREKHQIETAKIDEVKRRLSDAEMHEVVKDARAFALEYFGSDEDTFLQMSIDSIIKTTYLNNDQTQSQASHVQSLDNAEVKVCWSCKQEIQPISIVGRMYCSNCGVVLSKSETSQLTKVESFTEQKQNCRSCKNTVFPLRISGQLYCPECGVRL